MLVAADVDRVGIGTTPGPLDWPDRFLGPARDRERRRSLVAFSSPASSRALLPKGRARGMSLISGNAGNRQASGQSLGVWAEPTASRTLLAPLPSPPPSQPLHNKRSLLSPQIPQANHGTMGLGDHLLATPARQCKVVSSVARPFAGRDGDRRFRVWGWHTSTILSGCPSLHLLVVSGALQRLVARSSIQTPLRQPEWCSGIDAACPCWVAMCHSMGRCRRSGSPSRGPFPSRASTRRARDRNRQLACFEGRRCEGRSHMAVGYIRRSVTAQEVRYARLTQRRRRPAVCQFTRANPHGVWAPMSCVLNGTTPRHWLSLFLRGNQAFQAECHIRPRPVPGGGSLMPQRHMPTTTDQITAPYKYLLVVCSMSTRRAGRTSTVLHGWPRCTPSRKSVPSREA